MTSLLVVWLVIGMISNSVQPSSASRAACNSQAKGNIERFNKTVWNPLAQKFPTYLGKDMDKEAAAKVHKQTRSDIKEFGYSRLLPTWEEFREKCAAAVEKYNSKPHSGLPKICRGVLPSGQKECSGRSDLKR